MNQPHHLTAPGVTRELARTHNLQLKLDDGRRQLLLPREAVRLLPPELRAAIREHRDALLRRTIFLEAHLRFDAWMLGHEGVHREARPYLAGIEGLGRNGSLERLGDTWADPNASLVHFENAISAYLKTGVRAFEAAFSETVAAPTSPFIPELTDPRPESQPALESPIHHSQQTGRRRGKQSA